MDEWSCHVCSKVRPDDKISVHSREITRHGILITENVRYCNDNPECVEGAKEVRWIDAGSS